MNNACSLVLAGLLLAGCHRYREVAAREFFKNPESSAYRLSPSGKLVSFLKPSGKAGRLNLFVQPTTESKARCVTSEEERDITAYYFWKDESHIVYFICVFGDDARSTWHIRCVDLTAQDNPVQDRTPAGFNDMIDEFREDQRRILILVRGNAVKLDILSGETELVQTNPGDVQQWIPDEHGNILAALAGGGLDICLLTRRDPHGDFIKVLDMDFRESISPKSYNFGVGEGHPLGLLSSSSVVVLSGDTKGRTVLYALSNMKTKSGKYRDKYALVEIDPNTGDEIEERYANSDFDVNDMEVSKRGGIAAKFITWRNERQCLDGQIDSWYRQLQKHFSSDDVQIIAHDDAETRLIVQRSSDQNAGEYYLFTPATGDLKKLGESWPQLKGQLARIKPISFVSRDNRTINGYLTLPLGHKPTNLPLIVIPHGGPWWRNVWGFNRENREVQFFANHGYAVLQINFRSSTGYGREFWAAGFKQWGRAMQDDVTDGALWAITQKIADPKRIAIVGESYGGYAALAGITFTQGVHYAAAVDRAGISDLLMLFGEYQNDVSCDQLRVEIGDPNQESDRQLLENFSPALQCDKINTPLFLAHGTYDQQVPPEQSATMCDAMEKQGKDVQILWLAEGHIFQNEENLIAYYEAVDGFLKKHLH